MQVPCSQVLAVTDYCIGSVERDQLLRHLLSAIWTGVVDNDDFEVKLTVVP